MLKGQNWGFKVWLIYFCVCETFSYIQMESYEVILLVIFFFEFLLDYDLDLLFLFLGWLHLLICKKRGWKRKTKDILINLTIWFFFRQNMREIWRESLVTLMMMWYQVILWETTCHTPNSGWPKIWPMTLGQRFEPKDSS